jgi:2',3'-cyclic-nucleotide 2'-phosphodiesterase (5'-nucleotidase family)
VLKPLLEKYPSHLQVDAGGWSEIKADRRVVASSLLFEGFNAMGLDVANVSGRDLLLGDKAIEDLRASFSGTFVSANVELDGQPLFDTHTIVERQIDGQTVRIGITGVTLQSRAAQEAWETGNLDFRDPMQTAREMAETLRPQTDLRILLANLSVADLENFVAEFPDAYQFVVSGNGELRATTMLGVPPFVLAPGTSGKVLAWVNLAAGQAPGAGLEVSAGNCLTLDEKIKDDSGTADLVDDYRHRLRSYLQSRKSPETSTNGTSSGGASLAVPASGH